RDETIAVERDDGVVDHALDGQAELRLARAQLVLVTAALREVARDHREAEQLAARVADRGEYHARPESRAVLPQPPALVLEAPVRRRRLDLLRRHAARERLRRMEARRVLPD